MSWFQRRHIGESGYSSPPSSNKILIMSAEVIREAVTRHSYSQQSGSICTGLERNQNSRSSNENPSPIQVQ